MGCRKYLKEERSAGKVRKSIFVRGYGGITHIIYQLHEGTTEGSPLQDRMTLTPLSMEMAGLFVSCYKLVRDDRPARFNRREERAT